MHAKMSLFRQTLIKKHKHQTNLMAGILFEKIKFICTRLKDF